MGFQYSHLNELKRVVIESGLRDGLSQSAIAQRIGVSSATVSREIKRGSEDGQHASMAVLAERANDQGRRRAVPARRKLGDNLCSPAWLHVIDGLHARRSPQQIAGRDDQRDPLHGLLPRPEQRVSHQTIYCATDALPRGALKTELRTLLLRSRAGRRRRPSSARRSRPLQEITSTAFRPAEVADRTAPGHWEGDFLEGARDCSASGTFVERTSPYTLLARIEGCGAKAALGGFTRRLCGLPESGYFGSSTPFSHALGR